MLDLIETIHGGDRNAAVQWAKDSLGGFLAEVEHHCHRRSDHGNPFKAAAQPDVDAIKRTGRALEIFVSAGAFRTSPAEAYIRGRLHGAEVPENILNHADVRFDPRGAWRVYDVDAGRIVQLPTMLALMRDLRTGEPKALHRTALQHDGRGKAVMPDGSGPRAGCAIMLSGCDDGPWNL